MVGKKFVEKDGKMEVEDYVLGMLISFYEFGLMVKGVIVLIGFEINVIIFGIYFYDVFMKFKGIKEKKFWKNFGDIDDLRVL